MKLLLNDIPLIYLESIFTLDGIQSDQLKKKSLITPGREFT